MIAADYAKYGPGYYFYCFNVFTKYFPCSGWPNTPQDNPRHYRAYLNEQRIPYMIFAHDINNHLRVVSGMIYDGDRVVNWEAEMKKAVDIL